MSNSAKRVNRADLLRSLVLLGVDNLHITATMNGFAPPPRKKMELKISPLSLTGDGEGYHPEPKSLERSPQGQTAHFYRVVECKASDLLPEPTDGEGPEKPQWYQMAEPLDPDAIRPSAEQPPDKEPLVAWAKLWPVIRFLLSEVKRTRQPDIPRLVNAVAKGELLRRIPRKIRAHWAATVQVLVDRPERTRLFNQDYNQLLKQIELLRGGTGLEIQKILHQPGGSVLVKQGKTSTVRDWPMPVAGTTVFILSDLGLLDKSATALKAWLKVGKQLRDFGCRPVVLLPLPERYLNSDLVGLFECVIWDKKSSLRPVSNVTPWDEKNDTLPGKKTGNVSQLLTWLSPAMRVEPALLRAVRHRMPMQEMDVGHEAEAWHHDDVIPSPIGFNFQPGVLQKYRRQFRQQADDNPALAKTIASLIRDYHCHVFPTQREEELLILSELLGDKLEGHYKKEVQQARQEIARLVKAAFEQGQEIPGLSSFLGHLLDRQHDEVVNKNEFYQAIWVLRQKQLGVFSELTLPATWNVAMIAALLGGQQSAAQEYVLFQEGPEELKISTRKRFTEGKDDFTEGSPLAAFKTRSPYLLKQHFDAEGKASNVLLPLADAETYTLQLEKEENQKLHVAGEEVTVERFVRPDWATTIGRDHGALTAASRSQEGSQKFYWNPPVLSGSGGVEKDGADRSKEALSFRGIWYPELLTDSFQPQVPIWAEEAGRDRYGLYADALIAGISQRFRWIEPTSFLMGSPESEPGCSSDQTQHRVILTQGCWLADTACTQALWEAVMRKNPSGFKGKNKPVENISWDDIQKFLGQVNKRHPLLKLRLPTEAEWENGCRAGTRGAFNFEGELTLLEVNYRGTWDDYEKWGEGALQQTAEVKAYRPNHWGLYQMHGNVWEWCRDWFGEYAKEAVADPLGPESGDNRVLRGGSWFSDGRYCRSACRNHDDPSYRYDYFGFRLARGHELQPVRSDGGRTAGVDLAELEHGSFKRLKAFIKQAQDKIKR